MLQQLPSSKKIKSSTPRLAQSAAPPDCDYNINFSELFYKQAFSLRKVFGINKDLPLMPEYFSSRASKEPITPKGSSTPVSSLTPKNSILCGKHLPSISKDMSIKNKKAYKPYCVNQNFVEAANRCTGEGLRSAQQIRGLMGPARLPKTQVRIIRRHLAPVVKKKEENIGDNEEADLITGWE